VLLWVRGGSGTDEGSQRAAIPPSRSTSTTEAKPSEFSRLAGDGGADAGVVDENVDLAAFRNRRSACVTALGGVADIGGVGEHPSCRGAKPVGEVVKAVVAPGQQGHVGPGSGQGAGDLDAEPTARAGADPDLVLEADSARGSMSLPVLKGFMRA
jgi:hypothetical protein